MGATITTPRTGLVKLFGGVDAGLVEFPHLVSRQALVTRI